MVYHGSHAHQLFDLLHIALDVMEDTDLDVEGVRHGV